jgi:hypothetical protein
MKDMRRLKRGIWLALALPAAGCAKEGQGTGRDAPPPPRAADAATVAQAPPDAADAPPPPPPPVDAGGPVFTPPRCPEGAFCAPGAAAKRVAQGAEVKLDCPARLKELPTPTPDGAPSNYKGDLWINVDERGTKAKRDAADTDTCCYTWVIPCPGGRPLLADDGARVAPVRQGAGWGTANAAASPSALDAALARAWLADALAEHASVASFARATLELMAVGAPADLLAAVQRAALDEIRHARACFALAARHGGAPVEPGPLAALAPRGGGLPRLARDTFLEGCVGETIAALAVTRAAAGCADAELARTLRGIAADETRHAALAWRTVAWALAEGGAPVAEALAAAAAEARADEARGQAAGAPWAPGDAELAVHGRLPPAAQLATRRDAWRELIEPALADLLA